MSDKPITITVELSRDEAWALAQFIKRATWDAFRTVAKDHDDACVMVDAANKVRKALDEAGVSPR